MPATLANLITTRRGTRTYEQLAADCGGTPTAGRIQQMATKPQASFPSPETLRGLSKGLRVNPMVVLAAFAQSLGVGPGSAAPALVTLLPPGADTLTSGQVNAVLAVVQQFIDDNNGDAHEEGEI